MRVILTAVISAACTLGCSELRPTFHDRATGLGVRRVLATEADTLDEVCREFRPYKGNFWDGTPAKLAMDYEGTLVGGVSCYVGNNTDSGLGHVMVDICETTPAMARVREAVAAQELGLPEGCEKGPLEVARIRSEQLTKAHEQDCPRHGRSPEVKRLCQLLEIELSYYQNKLKGRPYGED